jgi:hypothetical protein
MLSAAYVGVMHEKEGQMNEALIEELNGLKQRDIETREKLLKMGRLYGSYDEEMKRVHVENAEALNRFVSVHGWPGISMVGLEGCRAAWLVAQHAIGTPALQRRFLQELEKASRAGEAPAKLAAFLSDRIRFNEGKPQVYGTVRDWNENGELDCEVEDPEHVDELRASAGLPPFAESLAEHREEVEAEGGKAPVDIESYREAGTLWAKQVGWR